MSRLIIAIVSTFFEEVAIVVIGIWLLPRLGIKVPLWALIIIMIAWTGWAVFTYRTGTRALEKKVVAGLSSMIGTKGRVVERLAPHGIIKIKGELWAAESDSDEIVPGEEVIVVKQEKLKLVVRRFT